MMDGVEMAFEEILPWGLFSRRQNHSLASIASLPATLAAVPDAQVRAMRSVLCSELTLTLTLPLTLTLQVRAMRSVLYCAWPRMLWLRHDGAERPLPEQAKLLPYDAFESVMWTLRKRLRNDIGWPADWEEGCRAVTDYFATPPKSAPREWKPWGVRDYDPIYNADGSYAKHW